MGWGATTDWGKGYAQRFGVDLYHSILAGVIDHPLMTMDSLHPTTEGVRLVARSLLPQVRSLVLAAQA